MNEIKYIHIAGVGGHSSDPSKGVDAIKFAYELAAQAKSDTFQVKNITGGTNGNTIADKAVLEVQVFDAEALEAACGKIEKEMHGLNNKCSVQILNQTKHEAKIAGASQATLQNNAITNLATDSSLQEVLNPKYFRSDKKNILIDIAKDYKEELHHEKINNKNIHELSRRFLAALVSFDSVSSTDEKKNKSNKDIVEAIAQYFKFLEIDYEISKNSPESQKLYGTQNSIVGWIGDKSKSGGLLYSAHTDVQPAVASEWKSGDPFILKESPETEAQPAKDGGDQGKSPLKRIADGQIATTKLYGRGAVDMKGFLALTLAQAFLIKQEKITPEKPLYFAYSWGEEIGCQGTDDMVGLLKKVGAKPDLYMIGEPTDGQIITAHKGGMFIDLKCIGENCSERMALLYAKVAEITKKYKDDTSQHDNDMKPPYPVINWGHVKTDSSGASAQIHVRSLTKEQGEKILSEISEVCTQAGVECKQKSFSRPLPTQNDSEGIINKIKKAFREAFKVEAEDPQKVSYATEAGGLHSGLSAENPNAAFIVCGPGDLGRGNAHKFNEQIENESLNKFFGFMQSLEKEFCGKAQVRER